MLLLLGGVLDVPLRERNALLQAGGFTWAYRETPLDDPQMAGMRHALELILRQHEPFGAAALDRHWNVVMVNEGYAAFIEALLGPGTPRLPSLTLIPAPRPNALRLLFDPAGLRPHVANWEVVAREILSRLHREALWDHDHGKRALLEELLSAPGVPVSWREPDLESIPALVIPVELRLGPHIARFFSTITTLGAPQDVTLQELRIESFHAADAETEALVRAMAGGR
jgi:hypothetical protein